MPLCRRHLALTGLLYPTEKIVCHFGEDGGFFLGELGAVSDVVIEHRTGQDLLYVVEFFIVTLISQLVETFSILLQNVNETVCSLVCVSVLVYS